MDLTLREALPVLAALAGALVGGVVGELRTIVQSARERRRALRMLLYQLLELRFCIATHDPRMVMPVLMDYVRRTFGSEALQALQSAGTEHLLRQMVAAAPTLFGSDPPMAAHYQEAIKALAPYDPVEAYRLSNQAEFQNLEREFRQYYDRAIAFPQIAADPQAAVVLPHVEAASVDVARSEALTQLAKNIHAVAWKVSPLTRYRAGRIVRLQDRIPGPELERLLDRFVMTVIGRLTQHTSAPSALASDRPQFSDMAVTPPSV